MNTPKEILQIWIINGRNKAALPVHNDVLHVMIVLPQRVYANDCTVCEYPVDRQVEILL